MASERQNTAAGAPDVSQQELDDPSRADDLGARRVLCPSQRVRDGARPVTARVAAQELCHLHHVLGPASAHAGDRLRRVGRVMALENLQDALGIRERGIDSRLAPPAVRLDLAVVHPRVGNAVRGGGAAPGGELGIACSLVFGGDEGGRVRVVDDVLSEVAFALEDVADHPAEEREVRPGADLDEDVGHGRCPRVARIHVDHHGAALLSHHRPVEADRMGLGHVRAHDQDAVAVDEVARMI